jgi:hypothetical protein
MGLQFIRRAGVVALLFTLLLALAPAGQPARATEGAVYFPETGFWVDPVFAQYWQDNGGLMTFGYPISRDFYQDGLHRQYFERAIFEHHEDNNGTPYAVLLARLGAQNTIERRKSDPLFQPNPDGAASQPDEVYFPETGHALERQFRGYWEQHGGLQTFGYPLSEPFSEPGLTDGVPHLVQYFERARFELHPENAGTQYEILLGHLGREALDARQVPMAAITRQEQTEQERDAGPLGPLPVGEPTAVGCGFNYAWWGDAAHDVTNIAYMDLAKASGCTWIRLQFTWADLEPTQGAEIEPRLWAYARIIQLARERGLHLLVNVTHPPDWARPNDPTVPAAPAAFAHIMGWLAQRFAGQVDAWQVWNEPNLIGENNGKIDPNGFFPLLKAAYPAIKAADPITLVVFPGLAPNSLMIDSLALDDRWYLETMLGFNHGEALNYFDVLGVQGYGAGNDPDHYYPSNLADNPGWTTAPEFYFRHVEALHNTLLAAGGASKPVWITEMGWPIGNFSDVYGYGAWITPELQAQYLTRAYDIMRTEWHWVQNAYVWHLNSASFGPDPNNSFAGFSITDQQSQPLPAFNAIEQMTTIWGN